MSHYHQIITEATGVTDFDDLDEIEDTMRHSIFHSTLDWQTREQLKTAAIEGWEIVQWLRVPENVAALEAQIEAEYQASLRD